MNQSQCPWPKSMVEVNIKSSQGKENKALTCFQSRRTALIGTLFLVHSTNLLGVYHVLCTMLNVVNAKSNKPQSWPSKNSILKNLTMLGAQ